MSENLNVIGKKVEDYRCPRCHYLNMTPFIKGKPVKRCFRCKYVFS